MDYRTFRGLLRRANVDVEVTDTLQQDQVTYYRLLLDAGKMNDLIVVESPGPQDTRCIRLYGALPPEALKEFQSWAEAH